MAKRRERRLDQGRAAAEIGVSPSTYRSYEKNTQRPSVNVFPLLAKFLGLEMEEFLTLYATTVIFALRPALEKELALQKDIVAAGAPSEVLPEAPTDVVTDVVVVDAREPAVIDVVVDAAPEPVETKEESVTYVRDDDAVASPPSDESEVVDDETFFEEESDNDDDDDDKEDDETSDPDTWGEMATPSISSQFSTFSTGFDGSAKKKKKKKKKK